MGKIQHHGTSRHHIRQHLKPARHRHIAEGLRQLAGAVRITPHQCHHRQSVVDVVLPRHPNVVGGAGCRELHTEQVPGLQDVHSLRPEIRRTVNGIGALFTGTARHHVLRLRVVGVEDAVAALGEQPLLAVPVVGIVRMLLGADVVRGEVGEHRRIEGDAVHPVAGQRLRGHLHHHIPDALVPHGPKQPHQLVALRCGIAGSHVLPGVGGADNAAGQAHAVHDGAGRLRHGGLALSTGDADDGQLPLGKAEKRRRDLRQRLTGIRYPHHVRILRHVQSPLADETAAALCIGRRRKVLSVGTGAPQTEKQAPGLRLPGVVGQRRDLLFSAAAG